MKFFVLTNPEAGKVNAVTDFLAASGSTLGDAPQCPVCGKYIGMLPLLPPVRVELVAWGTVWGDIAFGSGDQILVSQKLKRLFLEEGLAGFERFDPVEVVNIRRHHLSAGDPPFYELATIQHSRAAIDDIASDVVRDAPWTCADCRIDGIKRARRIVIEPNTWSGEDIFVARGLPGRILTTDRFKSLCDKNSLTNCRLIAAERFSFDHYPWERSPESIDR
jgi:hypothetical protein